MSFIKRSQQKYILFALGVLLIVLFGTNLSLPFTGEVFFNKQPVVYMNSPESFSEGSVYDMQKFYYKIFVMSGGILMKQNALIMTSLINMQKLEQLLSLPKVSMLILYLMMAL